MPPVYAIISFFSYRYFRSYTYYSMIYVGERFRSSAAPWSHERCSLRGSDHQRLPVRVPQSPTAGVLVLTHFPQAIDHRICRRNSRRTPRRNCTCAQGQAAAADAVLLLEIPANQGAFLLVPSCKCDSHLNSNYSIPRGISCIP
jgi:hypothetical protein